MKRFFSGKLYMEGLKQLRLIGFMALAVMEVVTLLALVGNTEPLPTVDELIITFLDFNPSLLGTFTLVAPLMTLYLFSFLNKRNASDFYHATPVKRPAVFFSLFLAIVTWLAALFAVTTLTASIYCAALGPTLTVDTVGILFATLNLFAAALLTAASTAIAMSVTGTAFTNIIVSLIIIFVPRVLMMIATTSVTEFVPIIPENTLGVPLDPIYNIPFALITSFMYGDPNTILSSWQGGLYTGCLALVYTAVAAWLFSRRKSETAGQSAPNRTLQAIYRLTVATVVGLPACWMLIDELLNDYNSFDLLPIVAWFAFAVLAYCAYELITTRKWKNLARALPGLVVLAGIYVIIIGGSVGICRSSLQFTPAADRIDAVSIINQGSAYLNARSSRVKITDKAAITAVADALDDTVTLLNEKGDVGYHESQLTRVRVKIYIGGRVYDRYVLMESEQEDKLVAALQKEPAFRDMYMKLPVPSDSLLSPTTYTIYTGKNEVDASSLYPILQAEINEIGFDRWFAQNSGSGNLVYTDKGYDIDDYAEPYYSYLSVTLRIATYVGGEREIWNISLDSHIPQTANAAIKLVNEEADPKQALDALRETVGRTMNASCWFEIGAFGLVDANGKPVDAFFDGYDTNTLSEDKASLFLAMLDELETVIGQPVSVDQPFYRVDITVYHYDKYDENTYTANSDINTVFYLPARADGTMPEFLAMSHTVT